VPSASATRASPRRIVSAASATANALDEHAVESVACGP